MYLQKLITFGSVFLALGAGSQLLAWTIDGGRQRQIWIASVASSGGGGTGTEADPFLVSTSADFDSLMVEGIAAGIKTFYLTPGTFQTKGYVSANAGSGWRLAPGTRFKGAGPQNTFLVRDRAVLGTPGGNDPGQMILAQGDNIEIADITIDCNATSSDSSSIGAVTITGNHAFVQRVVSTKAFGFDATGVNKHAHVFLLNGDGGRAANVVDQCLVRDVVVPGTGRTLSLSGFSGAGAVTFRECRAYLPAGAGVGFNTQDSTYHLVERCFVDGGASNIAGTTGSYRNITSLGSGTGTPVDPPVEEPPPSGDAIFDDFNRADGNSLGPNWNTVAGTFSITNQTARGELQSYGKNMAIYQAETPTLNQYARIKFNPNSFNGFVGFVLRYSDASSGHYLLDFNYRSCYWSYETDVATGHQRNIINGATSPAFPDLSGGGVVAVTVSGTGANTRVRIWFNVTATAPTAADLWDGQPPYITQLISAGPTADTGRRIGICTFQEAPRCTIDDFHAGSF